MQSLSFLLALVCALVLGLVSADPLGAGVPSISSSLSRRANEQRDSDKDNLLATTAAYDAWKARFQTDFEKGSTYVYKAVLTKELDAELHGWTDMGKVERILRSDHMYLVVVQVYLQDGKRLHADARFWDLYVKQKYVEREDLTSWPTAHHANEEWSTERVEDEHITYMPYQQGFHTPKLGVRLYLHAASKLYLAQHQKFLLKGEPGKKDSYLDLKQKAASSALYVDALLATIGSKWTPLPVGKKTLRHESSLSRRGEVPSSLDLKEPKATEEPLAEPKPNYKPHRNAYWGARIPNLRPGRTYLLEAKIPFDEETAIPYLKNHWTYWQHNQQEAEAVMGGPHVFLVVAKVSRAGLTGRRYKVESFYWDMYANYFAVHHAVHPAEPGYKDWHAAGPSFHQARDWTPITKSDWNQPAKRPMHEAPEPLVDVTYTVRYEFKTPMRFGGLMHTLNKATDEYKQAHPHLNDKDGHGDENLSPEGFVDFLCLEAAAKYVKHEVRNVDLRSIARRGQGWSWLGDSRHPGDDVPKAESYRAWEKHMPMENVHFWNSRNHKPMHQGHTYLFRAKLPWRKDAELHKWESEERIKEVLGGDHEYLVVVTVHREGGTEDRGELAADARSWDMSVGQYELSHSGHSIAPLMQEDVEWKHVNLEGVKYSYEGSVKTPPGDVLRKALNEATAKYKAEHPKFTYQLSDQDGSVGYKETSPKKYCDYLVSAIEKERWKRLVPAGPVPARLQSPLDAGGAKNLVKRATEEGLSYRQWKDILVNHAKDGRGKLAGLEAGKTYILGATLQWYKDSEINHWTGQDKSTLDDYLKGRHTYLIGLTVAEQSGKAWLGKKPVVEASAWDLYADHAALEANRAHNTAIKPLIREDKPWTYTRADGAHFDVLFSTPTLPHTSLPAIMKAASEDFMSNLSNPSPSFRYDLDNHHAPEHYRPGSDPDTFSALPYSGLSFAYVRFLTLAFKDLARSPRTWQGSDLWPRISFDIWEEHAYPTHLTSGSTYFFRVIHPWRLDAKLNEWDEDDRKRVVGMLGGKHMYLVAVRVSKEGIKLGTRNLVAKARYCDMYIPRRELDQHTATDSDHLPIRHYHVNQDWPYQDGRDTKFELVYSIKTSGRIEKNLQLATWGWEWQNPFAGTGRSEERDSPLAYINYLVRWQREGKPPRKNQRREEPPRHDLLIERGDVQGSQHGDKFPRALSSSSSSRTSHEDEAESSTASEASHAVRRTLQTTHLPP